MSKSLVFTMEGIEHTKHTETNCCSEVGKTCECGGFMHYEPIDLVLVPYPHGGDYYKCELCLKDERFDHIW